jgi:hypothetical protein
LDTVTGENYKSEDGSLQKVLMYVNVTDLLLTHDWSAEYLSLEISLMTELLVASSSPRLSE